MFPIPPPYTREALAGDAAHTTSPSGGQGLNIALQRDAFVAANHLGPALRRGAATPRLLQCIEDKRMPEVTALQAGQTRADQMALNHTDVLHPMLTQLAVAMRLVKRLGASNGIARRSRSFSHRWRRSAPARDPGDGRRLTDHVWSMEELLDENAERAESNYPAPPTVPVARAQAGGTVRALLARPTFRVIEGGAR